MLSVTCTAPSRISMSMICSKIQVWAEPRSGILVGSQGPQGNLTLNPNASGPTFPWAWSNLQKCFHHGSLYLLETEAPIKQTLSPPSFFGFSALPTALKSSTGTPGGNGCCLAPHLSHHSVFSMAAQTLSK